MGKKGNVVMGKKGNVGTKIVVWWGGLVGRRSDRGGL